MKKLYHLTIITLVCTFFSAIARLTKTKKPLATAKATPTLPLPQNNKTLTESPTPPSKTYKQLRDDIAQMKSNMVVAPDGIFTDYFITFINENAEKYQLPDTFIKALLEAGMSFHAPLNENNAFTLRALKRNSKQIYDIINAKKSTTAQSSAEKQPPIKPKEPNSQPTPSELKQPLSEPSPQHIKPKESSFQPIPQQPHSIEKLSGIAGLSEFRKQTINEPLKTFYSDGIVNTQWLRKALHILLAGQPLTSKNKEQMQGQLVGNTTELMRELLHKYQIPNHLWNLYFEDIKKQTFAFMDNQPLFDQKQIPLPTLPAKTPQMESAVSQPKTPASEPQPKMAQKADRDPNLPDWMTPQNTLIIKELEIEILRYIFKNPKVSQEATAQHFIQQIPKNIKTREILINGIKATVGILLQEPLESNISNESLEISPQETSPQDTLPYWIDAKRFNVKPSKLDPEITKFIATHTDADTDTIANHFIGLIPANIARKKLIESQIRATIEDFLAQ